MTATPSNLNTKNNIAIAYARVSTQEQGKKGLSIDYQKDMIKKYVNDYNELIDESNLSDDDKKKKKLDLNPEMILEEIKPASTILTNNVDNDINETLQNRPKLQQIIDLAMRKEFGHLILLSRDRLTRDFEQFIALKYIFKKNGITIHYCRPGENVETGNEEMNRFIDNILASVAELEANLISVRVKNGARHCVENGYWPGGKPPAGYLLEKIKVPGKIRLALKLKPSIYERSKIKEVFSLYNQGYGYRRTAEIMRNKYDDNLWTKSKVEGIIKNETYTGQITWDRRGGRRHPGKHNEDSFVRSKNDPSLSFLTTKQWHILQQFRQYKSEIKDPKYYDTPYLLKNKLICGICNSKLKTKNYGKNKDGQNYCVYKCPKNNQEGKSELILQKEEIEQAILNEVKVALKFPNPQKLWLLYKEQEELRKKEIGEEIADLDLRKTYLRKLKSNINQMISDLQDRNQFKSNNKNSGSTQPIDLDFYALTENLLHQQMLLDKVYGRYESEETEKKDLLGRQLYTTQEDYLAAINRFFVDIDKYDERSKRILIDLVIDKILVTNTPSELDIKIIFCPSKVLKWPSIAR